MTYIINPIWFYLMSIVDALKTIMVVVSIVMLVGVICCVISVTDSIGEELKRWMKRTKMFFALCCLCAVLAALIPSKETLMQIMIAKYATYENADNAIQAIKSAADYVIEAAGKLK